jgi:hypothetical protein
MVFHNRGVAGRRSLCVRLRGPPGNPTAVGARISVELADGTSQASEVYAGSGYYSQSAAACFFGYPEGSLPLRVVVRWPTGQMSEHAVPKDSVNLAIDQPPAIRPTVQGAR